MARKKDTSGRYQVGDLTAPTYNTALSLAQNMICHDPATAAKVYVRDFDGRTLALVERVDKVVYTRRLVKRT